LAGVGGFNHKAIVVFTDGTDVVSTGFAGPDVPLQANAARIPIHTISLTNVNLQPAGQETGRTYLSELASASRGIATALEDSAAVQGVWDRISAFRNHKLFQYTIEEITEIKDVQAKARESVEKCAPTCEDTCDTPSESLEVQQDNPDNLPAVVDGESSQDVEVFEIPEGFARKSDAAYHALLEEMVRNDQITREQKIELSMDAFVEAAVENNYNWLTDLYDALVSDNEKKQLEQWAKKYTDAHLSEKENGDRRFKKSKKSNRSFNYIGAMEHPFLNIDLFTTQEVLEKIFGLNDYTQRARNIVKDIEKIRKGDAENKQFKPEEREIIEAWRAANCFVPIPPCWISGANPVIPT